MGRPFLFIARLRRPPRKHGFRARGLDLLGVTRLIKPQKHIMALIGRTAEASFTMMTRYPRSTAPRTVESTQTSVSAPEMITSQRAVPANEVRVAAPRTPNSVTYQSPLPAGKGFAAPASDRGDGRRDALGSPRPPSIITLPMPGHLFRSRGGMKRGKNCPLGMCFGQRRSHRKDPLHPWRGQGPSPRTAVACRGTDGRPARQGRDKRP